MRPGPIARIRIPSAVRTCMRVLAREDRGSQLVEFALAALMLFTVILGIADICRAMYAYHFATYAAQQGSRYAMVRGADWPSSCLTSAPPNFTLTFQCQASAADVQNFVKNLPGINPDNMSATTTWPGTTPSCTGNCSTCSKANAQGCMVQVQANYTFKFIVPFLPHNTVTFTATSMKAIQQ